jgi:hypothetical protein
MLDLDFVVGKHDGHSENAIRARKIGKVPKEKARRGSERTCLACAVVEVGSFKAKRPCRPDIDLKKRLI